MIFLNGLIIFVIIILVHELGHFVVGKFYGIKFATFCIGMGPRIFQKRLGDTVYCLSILPIGGYVRSNAHRESTENENSIFENLVSFLAPISEEEIKLMAEFKNEQAKIEDSRPFGFIA